MGKLTRQQEVEYFVCDICGDECKSFHRQCDVCEAYVCPKGDCHYVFENHTICKWCKEIEKEFMDALYAERKASIARQIDINDRWKAASIECKEQANATKS